MIQLKVYEQTDKDPVDSIFLDLYESEPIKLTISIEDITNTEATSVFSRTFKVPATNNNSEFFKNAFDVAGVTYDITKKKPAEILIDGAEYKVGHIRLQRIYINADQDKIDYELLFLGETRDFSTVLADLPLCQLVMDDLKPAQGGDLYERSEIIQSWEAYPSDQQISGAPLIPSQYNGLSDGNILFPLIDFGNTYNSNSYTNEAQITVDDNAPNRFTQHQHPLAAGRMKPMIRAKRVWDQIFENANYTYDSEFLNSLRFKQMYVSAFGNKETVGIDIAQSADTQFEATENTNQGLSGDIVLNDIVYNPTGRFNPGTNLSTYTAPAGNTGAEFYIMEAFLVGDLKQEQSDYGYDDLPWRTQLVNQTTGVVIASGNTIYGEGTSDFTWDSRNGPDNVVNAGDKLYITIDNSNGDYDICTQAYWECTAAPGDYLASNDLDCEYKQIDYIKDILTMFRLVMQPDVYKPNHFIIEPWQDFIGAGDTLDWSKKLVKDKDFIIDPLFDSQSQTIEFQMEEDEDFINSFHFDNYKHVYGWLQFNSANELLKGKRDITVENISPTPINQINHSGTNHPHLEWVLPNMFKTDTVGDGNDTVVQRLPIKPNTRFMFYNGLQDIDQNASGSNKQWYLVNGSAGTGKLIRWPLVSPYEHWPVTEDSLNLNFYNDVKYYDVPGFGTLYPTYLQDGQTLYNAYWSRYIESIYNKFSRKVTAYFILDNTDLQNLTFDDIIFVNGVYYRPQLISNAELGSKTAVQVELITLLDAQPVWRDEILTGLSCTGVAPITQNSPGSIDITTNGTPPFTVTLDNGQTANFNPPVGQAPYTLTFFNAVPNDYVITVVDNLQRTDTCTATVPQYNFQLPASWLLENSQQNVSSTATYDPQYSIGQSVDLVGQPGACWTILSSSQVPPIVTILGICNPAAGNKYDIRDCDSDLGYILEKDGTNHQLGDVVNYEKLSNPGQIRCGAIVSITSNATTTGELYSQSTYQCGDLVHCYIEE